MCRKASQVIRAFCCANDMYQGRKQSGGCALATWEYGGARARANDLVTGLGSDIGIPGFHQKWASSISANATPAFKDAFLSVLSDATAAEDLNFDQYEPSHPSTYPRRKSSRQKRGCHIGRASGGSFPPGNLLRESSTGGLFMSS